MKKIYFLAIFGLFSGLVCMEIENSSSEFIKPKSVTDVNGMIAPLRLINAVNEGDVNSVLKEIANGASPSTFDHKTNKPVLSLAIEIGILNDKLNYADVAKVLIEKGADVNATDSEGYMPLDYLFKTGHQGATNRKRIETQKEFNNRLKELLLSKGARNSEKYNKEKDRKFFLS